MAEAVEAVIFDLDGTLVDHIGSAAAALRMWLPSLGCEPTDDLVQAWFAAEERHFPAWLSGQVTFAEQRRRRLRDFLPLLGACPGNDDGLDCVFAGYLSCYEASWIKFDDVDDALDQVADLGLRVAVLSNGTSEQQRAKLKAVGLSGCVGELFTAEDLGAAKPDPATYLAACAKLNVRPGVALHVGDHHELDVLAPRTAGVQALHLDRTDRGPTAERARIHSLDELPAWLRDQRGSSKA